MAQMNFDATQVEPSETFAPIPAGEYLGQILNSEMRPTSKGTGQFLWLEHEILDGEYKGRKLWNTLNIVNPNPDAVQIAQRTLSSLCHAVGELNVSDSEQLHFKPVMMVVKVKPADAQYPAKNEIGNYKIASGTQIVGKPVAQAQVRQAAPASAPVAAKATAPWNRSKAA